HVPGTLTLGQERPQRSRPLRITFLQPLQVAVDFGDRVRAQSQSPQFFFHGSSESLMEALPGALAFGLVEFFEFCQLFFGLVAFGQRPEVSLVTRLDFTSEIADSALPCFLLLEPVKAILKSLSCARSFRWVELFQLRK